MKHTVNQLFAVKIHYSEPDKTRAFLKSRAKDGKGCQLNNLDDLSHYIASELILLGTLTVYLELDGVGTFEKDEEDDESLDLVLDSADFGRISVDVGWKSVGLLSQSKEAEETFNKLLGRATIASLTS